MTGHTAAIKIHGIGTVNQFTSGVASIDIPEDGEILAVLGHVSGAGMDALNDQAIAELSFLSTHQIEVNDARGSILDVMVRQGFLTNGGGATSAIVSISFPSGDGIPVNGGERLFLHTFGDAGVIPKATFMIYLSSGGARRRTRRR